MAEKDEALELLASLGISSGGGAAKKKNNKKKKPSAGSASAAAAAAANDAEGDSGGEEEAKPPVVAAAAAPAKEPAKAKEAAKPAAAAAAPAPKLSKIAKAAQEAQAKAAREREEKLRIEQEEARLAAEEARAAEEEARKAEEEKERRKKKKEEKLARDREAGVPVTAAEKAKAKKLAAERERLLAAGLVSAQALESKKTTYGKKKPVAAKPAAAAVEAPPAAVAAPAPAPAAPVKREKDWDESSSEEEVEVAPTPPPAPVPAPKPVAKAAAAPAPKPAPAPKKQQQKQATASAAKKPVAPSESESESESDSEDSDEEGKGSSSNKVSAALKQKIERARAHRLERTKRSREEARASGVLRSPICCVLGHVDTGKTSILDMLRKTNVQEGEAGGITQQIGATFFPAEVVRSVADRLPEEHRVPFKIPGLQVIDTPGHEAFSNLRSRGSGLADVAILVIDIMHGLEQQTIESIELLKMRKTRFVVALNKVDRLFGWKKTEGAPIRAALALQSASVMSEFETRVKNCITQLMEQGLNAKLYWENDNWLDTVCVIPTSAHTGEGSPDLIATIVKISQDQMFNRLSLSNELECTVLEVKKIEGLGMTVDVCLVNGTLHDTDTIVLASTNGPIVTQIRGLLTPHPMREMRVRNEYILHKEIKGSMGIKITCQADLSQVVAGTSLYQVTPDDDVEELKDAVMLDVKDGMKEMVTVPRGVIVHASTLGSLEALMVHLKKENIPVSGVMVGPVRKQDVTRACTMLEDKRPGAPDPEFLEREYASILAFDVKVDSVAQDYAAESGVRIFSELVIYRLADNYLAHAKECRNERKKRAQALAVFPCIVKIIRGNVFNAKNPLVVGVDVVRGCCVVGTPLCIPEKLVDDPDNPGQKKMLELGRVVSIEKDHVAVDKAVRGDKVCIKIQSNSGDQYVLGRHFDEKNEFVSKITRKSLDLLKVHFREEVDKLKDEGWPFIQHHLKKVFKL